MFNLIICLRLFQRSACELHVASLAKYTFTLNNSIYLFFQPCMQQDVIKIKLDQVSPSMMNHETKSYV